MTDLIYFLIGLAVTLVVSFGLLYLSPAWEPFKERMSAVRARWSRKHAPVIRLGPVVLDAVAKAQLQPMTVGAMILPIRRFVGGDGRTLYSYPEGVVSAWNPDKLVLPSDVMEVYTKNVEKRRREAEARGAAFENRDHVRLNDFSIGLDGLHDMPWPLRLDVGLTDYYTIQATNYAIDEVLPGGLSIRKKYATDPGDMKGSILGNPLATNLSVVTADEKVYVAVRGRKTAATPSGLAPAVSGTGNPHLDRDPTGEYNPFLTAQREAAEEITGAPPELEEIRFFGLARTLGYQLPFLFGEVRLKTVTSRQLESRMPRDSWEAEKLVAIPLEINAVLGFVREVYAETEENAIVNSATYAALFSVLMSLAYEYPDEWPGIVEQLESLPKRAS